MPLDMKQISVNFLAIFIKKRMKFAAVFVFQFLKADTFNPRSIIFQCHDRSKRMATEALINHGIQIID
jgi:hypothetical protein